MDRREKGMVKQRVAYIDHLRIAATFAVVVIHVAAQNWYSQEVSTFAWATFNFFDSVTRWAVPAFVMISGALMLQEDVDFKKLYTVKIPRRLAAFLFWSAVYALHKDCGLKTFLLHVIKGKYHLWFLYLIIGLYICIPIIKKIAEDHIVAEYFLAASLVFTFLVPVVLQVLSDFVSEDLAKACTDAYNDMNLAVLGGYVAYFIAGFRLSQITLSKTKRRIIYVLGVLGIIATIFLTAAASVKEGVPVGDYYGYLGINVFAPSAAAFVWFKHNLSHVKADSFLMKQLTKCSFGIYLVHILVLEMLDKKLALNTLCFHPIASVLLISVVVFVLSFAISALFNRIPVIKKFVV